MEDYYSDWEIGTSDVPRGSMLFVIHTNNLVDNVVNTVCKFAGNTKIVDTEEG